MRTGLTEELIAQLADYENSTLLPSSWKAALRLTDHVSGANSGQIPAELYEQLREHFTEAQILRLGALTSVASGWQRMIEAFGIRPDHYEPGQDGPWESATAAGKTASTE